MEEKDVATGVAMLVQKIDEKIKPDGHTNMCSITMCVQLGQTRE